MTERADALIIGAGASGGVAARHLAERGFDVVCLEQGDWPDRSAFPGTRPDWELAIAAGARLITGARVNRITVGAGGLATGATWLDRNGLEHHQRADVVLLAANAIGTARLLLLSTDDRHCPDGLANSSGLVGRRLMMHPFSVVTGWWDDQVEGWQGQFGASITTYQFYETDPNRGFLRGAKWALSPVGGPLNHILPMRAGNEVWGADHHALVARTFGRGASWAIFGEDLPEESNRVELDPDRTDGDGIAIPRLHYRISGHSRRLMAFHEARAVESLEASGCGATGTASMIPYSGWHLMGTARMGTDPSTSVVNTRQQAHDVENLYVLDGSVFVTSSGVNPTCTITALALRTADLLVRGRRSQKVPA